MMKEKAGIEERLNKLEERLKAVFAEIEKRFEDLQQKPEYSFEERIQEIEDLVLLLQLENTKLREKVGEGLDFGISSKAPDYSERIERLEEEMGKSGTTSIVADDGKIAELEDRLNSIELAPVKIPKDVEHRIKEMISSDVKELDKKIKTLEALLEKRGRAELEQESHLLSDINSILGS